jgi:hypothetical protein
MRSTQSHGVSVLVNIYVKMYSKAALCRVPHQIAMGASCATYEGRRPLGRHTRTKEDNIKMDLREVQCGGTDWIDLTHDRDRWRAVVKAVMNLRVL